MCRDWQCDVTAVETLITEKEDKAYVTTSVFSTTELLLCITRSLTWFFMLNCHASNVLRMYKLCMWDILLKHLLLTHCMAAVINMAIFSMTHKPSQMMQFSAGH